MSEPTEFQRWWDTANWSSERELAMNAWNAAIEAVGSIYRKHDREVAAEALLLTIDEDELAAVRRAESGESGGGK